MKKIPRIMDQISEKVPEIQLAANTQFPRTMQINATIFLN